MKALVIGGSKFFGKRLVNLLVQKGHNVTVLNRGNSNNEFDNRVQFIKCDRTNEEKLTDVIDNKDSWDVIFDQVCYDHSTAVAASRIFKEKTNHYIFTSSMSVYDTGENINESEFNPKNHIINKLETKDSNYGEAKRQAEVAFTENAAFPTTFVRFPIVLGSDDYTKRFLFHLEKIEKEEAIFFPEYDAKMSFISSQFAAESLLHLAEKNILGPINIAAPDPISIRDMMGIIENHLDKRVVHAPESTPKNHSPYGVRAHWYMDLNKLHNSGLKSSSIRGFIKDLIIRSTK